jgi:hypothetical protein
VVPAPEEAEVGQSEFKASPGIAGTRPYVKNQLKAEELGHDSTGRAPA